MRTTPCSVIQSTRLGFFYQDSYAIVRYLNCLAKKNIKQFFVDYPLPNRKSLDILILNSNEEEEIYEIKSGDRFPERNTEIIEALTNLHEYWEEHPATNLHLVIRKTYRDKIIEFWRHIKTLNDHPSLITELAQSSSIFIMDKLNLKSPDEAHTFCRRLRLIDEYDDKKENPYDTLPPLMDQAVSIVKDLSVQIQATECEYELPSELLILRLFNTIAIKAGSGCDLHSCFLDCIIRFFARRKLFAEHYESKNSREIKEQELVDKIAVIFRDEFGVGLATKGMDIDVTKAREGGAPI